MRRNRRDTCIVLRFFSIILLAVEVKDAAAEKVEEAKEAGAQLADDASKKVDEVKEAAQDKVDEAKEAGTQLAADASNAAEEAKTTIVEKVQEVGTAVRMTIHYFLMKSSCSRLQKQYKPFQQLLLMLPMLSVKKLLKLHMQL